MIIGISNRNSYDNLVSTMKDYFASKIDTLSEQEKYWSEDQKVKAKEIQQLIEWRDCINSYGGHGVYNKPLMQYFSPNYEEEILKQSKRR